MLKLITTLFDLYTLACSITCFVWTQLDIQQLLNTVQFEFVLFYFEMFINTLVALASLKVDTT